MKNELVSQYEIALTMLRGVVDETADDVWIDRDDSREAAWHIAYHAAFYANIYCSPSEAAIKSWGKQRENCQILGPTPWPPHQRLDPGEPFSKSDILAFIDFVRQVIPGYIEQLGPDQPCWPHWYQQNQFEFHLNNLRHIQHHTAQLVERNGGTDVGWPGVG